jgi:hypothetical protein
MINLCDRVLILKSVPEKNLCAGEMGVVVFIHENGQSLSVEFVDRDGRITAFVTEEEKFFSRLESRVRVSANSSVHSNSVTLGRSQLTSSGVIPSAPVYVVA